MVDRAVATGRPLGREGFSYLDDVQTNQADMETLKYLHTSLFDRTVTSLANVCGKERLTTIMETQKAAGRALARVSSTSEQELQHRDRQAPHRPLLTHA